MKMEQSTKPNPWTWWYIHK